MSAENKVLIRKWFEEVWNKGRVSAIDDLASTQAVIHGLTSEPIDLAGFKQFHAAYRNAFPDIKLQVDDVVSEGEKIAVRWSGTGTHLGDGLGFPPTGNPVRLSGMLIMTVDNGKLVEGWNSLDELGLAQQIGAITLPA